MKCPSCQHVLNPGELIRLAFSRSYLCLVCNKRSEKSTVVELVFYGVLVVFTGVIDFALSKLNIDSGIAFFISLTVAVLACFISEHFWGHLVPTKTGSFRPPNDHNNFSPPF
jgi:hypothetical protein